VEAQILNAPLGKEFGMNPKFNPKFIANNQISKISQLVEIKKDGDRIRGGDRKQIFHFNKAGKPKMIVDIDQSRDDTSITVFEYVGSRLSCEVKNDAAGMYSYCYSYDDRGRPLSRKYSRTSGYNTITASVSEKLNSEITSENYSYASYENQLHSTLHNASGRPYLKEIRYFDTNGYLEKYLQTYVMSSSRHQENYRYNKRGWLSEKKVETDSDSYTMKFEYDVVGNIQHKKRFENGKLIYRQEYVYKPESMLLRAELKRDVVNNLIVISSYEYEFR
jgi:hypothetical protein